MFRDADFVRAHDSWRNAVYCPWWGWKSQHTPELFIKWCSNLSLPLQWFTFPLRGLARQSVTLVAPFRWKTAISLGQRLQVQLISKLSAEMQWTGVVKILDLQISRPGCLDQHYGKADQTPKTLNEVVHCYIGSLQINSSMLALAKTRSHYRAISNNSAEIDAERLLAMTPSYSFSLDLSSESRGRRGGNCCSYEPRELPQEPAAGVLTSRNPFSWSRTLVATPACTRVVFINLSVENHASVVRRSALAVGGKIECTFSFQEKRLQRPIRRTQSWSL